MKRFCFVVMALLVGLSSVSAKKRKEVNSDLVGIWQQVGKMGSEDGKMTIAYNPVLKIIEKDGTFSTMFVFSQQSAGSITQKGTFEITNDSIYTETIQEHFTHLPQIAAKGAAHYKVYKEDTDEATVSHIRPLTTEERIGELAQMMSAGTLTDAAVNNAREMLGI